MKPKMTMPHAKIIMGHGSGGKLMHGLIRDLILKKLSNPLLRELADSAVIDYKERIAFTTDSFVVSPLFFPGADIGKLAVCGTINDLVMQGARPEYLSLALIIEEGLEYGILEKVVDSISLHSRKSGAKFVTGDLKVVEKGACDKIFINTSGVGRIAKGKRLSVKNIEPGDALIVTGPIGLHGLSVLTKRKELDLGFDIKSDCAALDSLLLPVLEKTGAIKFMRDPTRGGLATTLNEAAQNSERGFIIQEKNIPVQRKVKAACELLGIDPLYIANEGIAMIVAHPSGADKVLELLKKHPLGRHAARIGTVAERPKGRVILDTLIGTRRIIDMLISEALPRIC